MEVPKDLKYTQEHEWIRIDGNKAVVGITGFAQEQLGDIVFVELPEVGTEVEQESPFGVGERSDIPVCLSAMDTFCLSSRIECFSNVVLEEG